MASSEVFYGGGLSSKPWGGGFNRDRVSARLLRPSGGGAGVPPRPLLAGGKPTSSSWTGLDWNWRNFLVAALAAPLLTCLILMGSHNPTVRTPASTVGQSHMEATPTRYMSPPPRASAAAKALHGERLRGALHTGSVAVSLHAVKALMEAMPSTYSSATYEPPEPPLPNSPEWKSLTLSLTPWSAPSSRQFHPPLNSTTVLTGQSLHRPSTIEAQQPQVLAHASRSRDPVAKMRITRRCTDCQAMWRQYELNQMLLQKLKQLALQSGLSSCSSLTVSASPEVEAFLCPHLALTTAAGSFGSQDKELLGGKGRTGSPIPQWGKMGLDVLLGQPATVSPDAWVLAHLRRVVQKIVAISASVETTADYLAKQDLGQQPLLVSAAAWLERRLRKKEASMRVLCRAAPVAVEWPDVVVEPVWKPSTHPSDILASLGSREPYTMIGQKELVLAPLPGREAASGTASSAGQPNDHGPQQAQGAGLAPDTVSPRLRKIAAEAPSEWRRDPNLYPPADGKPPALATFSLQYFHQPECVPDNVKNLYTCGMHSLLNSSSISSRNYSRADWRRPGSSDRGSGSVGGASPGGEQWKEEKVTQWAVDLAAGFELRVNVDEPSAAQMWRMAWEAATVAAPVDADARLKDLEDYEKSTRTNGRRRRLLQQHEQPEEQQQQQQQRERAPSYSNVLYLVFGHNTHEMHGYNRNARAARGQLFVILQDDEKVPNDCTWFDRFTSLFYQHDKSMGSMGYKTGRVYADGPLFQGPVSFYRQARERGMQPYVDPGTGVRGYPASVVDIAPYVMPRMLWHAMGGYDLSWTRRGWSGIMMDWQYSFRLWLTGFHVYHVAWDQPQWFMGYGPRAGGTHVVGKGLAFRNVHATVNNHMLEKYFFGPLSPFLMQGLQLANSLMSTLDVWR